MKIGKQIFEQILKKSLLIGFFKSDFFGENICFKKCPLQATKSAFKICQNVVAYRPACILYYYHIYLYYITFLTGRRAVDG